MTALPRCDSSPFNLYNRYSTFLFVHKGFKLCSGFEFHKKSGFKIEMLLFHNRSQNLSRNTGGPSSSCEMIILRSKIRGEIKIVCMGIFTTAPRNKKKYGQPPYIPIQTLIITPWLIFRKMVFSQLELGLSLAKERRSGKKHSTTSRLSPHFLSALATS